MLGDRRVRAKRKGNLSPACVPLAVPAAAGGWRVREKESQGQCEKTRGPWETWVRAGIMMGTGKNRTKGTDLRPAT